MEPKHVAQGIQLQKMAQARAGIALAVTITVVCITGIVMGLNPFLAAIFGFVVSVIVYGRVIRHYLT